jgi:hypothetical protein
MMISRRKIVLVGMLAAAAATARTAVADAAAQAFVASIYNAYKGRGGNGISLDSEASVRRYFEPALAALIIKDRKRAVERGEAPALSSDPFVDASDWDIAAFDIAVQDVAPSKARATVKFENSDKPQTVVLDLVKLKEGWRIEDISWERDGETETLHALLSK